MKRNDFVFELGGDASQPLFLRLAASILREIERGRIKPGDALPGTRLLARNLNVHRNTVTAAFHELIMQGWLVTAPSRGTIVAPDLPTLGLLRQKTGGPGKAPLVEAEPLPAFRISDGIPDSRIMPGAELARAFRRALSGPGLFAGHGYGDPRDAYSLRHALTEYLLQERGLTTSPNELLVTRGSQMAIYLAAAATIEPGQKIAVEEPGYPLAWAAFRAVGAQVVGVPVDSQGLDVASLERILRQEPDVRALYVTPHHQYPTTATLGAGRRLRLLEIARHHRLTIIEDDYDHEYRFEGRPVLPLAARADQDVSVIYIGSLSKLLSPAVRLGYASARQDVIDRMARRREVIDRQGDIPLEEAMAELIRNGTLARHARKARRIYAARRNLLVSELRERLGDALDFTVPSGGLALWAGLRPGFSADDWASEACRAGLLISPGDKYVLDAGNAPNAFRIGFAQLADDEIPDMVRLLAATKPR